MRAFCSTSRMVMPSSRFSRRMMPNTFFTSSGDSPIEGSPIRISFGRAISARPIASICCSPPER